MRAPKVVELSPGSRAAICNYARRNIWLDVADLEQEASLAVLEAARRRETTGRPYSESGEAFMVALALSRLVAEARVPVSIPKYRGDTWEAATAARSVSLFARGKDGAETAEERRELAQVAVDHHVDAEDRLDAARALRALHRLMSEESEAARAVLLGDEKPASVAKSTGLAVAKVYADTARAMRNLRASMCPQLAKG